MSILLSDLVSQLETDVPAEEGVPSAAQYAQAVKEAVADFGNRAGRAKRATLNVVSGTEAYTLPADFLKMIQLPSLNQGQAVLVSAEGLIPLSSDFSETYTLVDGQIVFYPVPTYSLARSYRYKAGFALENEAYAELETTQAEILMRLARSQALRRKSNALGGGMSYRQGDVSVDTTASAGSLLAQAETLKADYLSAVEAYNGTVLVMG